MTAVQHTGRTHETEDLPHALRRLETAEPGSLAAHPERDSACAIKMGGDSGRPWLLDPYGHEDGPSHVTSAYLAVMGYRTDAHTPPRKEADDYGPGAFEEHVAALREAGWTAVGLAARARIGQGTARSALQGRPTYRTTRQAILAVHPDDPQKISPPTSAEQAEDLEWLLLGGVSPDIAAERCGYASAESARRAMHRRGRPDLVAYLLDNAPEDDNR